MYLDINIVINIIYMYKKKNFKNMLYDLSERKNCWVPGTMFFPITMIYSNRSFQI